MIEYIQGDIIKAFQESKTGLLLNQNNLTVGMGAGIAKTIANLYPDITVKDLKIRTEAIIKPEACLGDILIHSLNDTHAIINIYSQYNPGCPKKGFDTFEQRIHWLKVAFSELRYLYNHDEAILFFPLIASGMAKDITKQYTSDLDYFKKYIVPVIEECLADFTIKVYYL